MLLSIVCKVVVLIDLVEEVLRFWVSLSWSGKTSFMFCKPIDSKWITDSNRRQLKMERLGCWLSSLVDGEEFEREEGSPEGPTDWQS